MVILPKARHKFASATVTNVNDPPPANAGMPKGVCPGEAVALTATGGVDYKWSNGVVQNQSFVPTQTQTYTVTVTGSNACTATATVTVTVYPLPSIQISGPTALCMGSATLDAGNGFAYIWSSGETTQQITVTSTKLYTVTVTDGNGCTGTGTRTIGLNTTSLTPKISGPAALCGPPPPSSPLPRSLHNKPAASRREPAVQHSDGADESGAVSAAGA